MPRRRPWRSTPPRRRRSRTASSFHTAADRAMRRHTGCRCRAPLCGCSRKAVIHVERAVLIERHGPKRLRVVRIEYEVPDTGCLTALVIIKELPHTAVGAERIGGAYLSCRVVEPLEVVIKLRHREHVAVAAYPAAANGGDKLPQSLIFRTGGEVLKRHGVCPSASLGAAETISVTFASPAQAAAKSKVSASAFAVSASVTRAES